MKFILTIYICTAIAQQCGPPIVQPIKYKNWSECIFSGYEKSEILLKNYSVEQMNEYQMMTKFTCIEEPGEDT